MHPVGRVAFLEDWLPILAEHDIDIMHIMPDTGMSDCISWDEFDRIDRQRYKVFPDYPGTDKKPSFVSLRKKSDQFEREHFFSFPAHTEWNSKDHGQWFLPSPFVLGQTITYLKKEFGLEPMWGPGNMGMKELKQTFASHGWQFSNTLMTDKMKAVLNRPVYRQNWKFDEDEGLTDEQKQKKYWHCYDKNGQFTGAAQSVFLGNGDPHQTTEVNLGTIGFWRYEITDVSQTDFDSYGLLCPLEFGEWASSDLLLAARYAGIEFDILEGYTWPRGAKYLEDWAKRMWAHRTNLRDKIDVYVGEIARENAVGTAKLAANMLMGRLAKPGTRELFKPDWNLLIVHKAIANQVYSFKNWSRKYGIKPVLVSTDNFWILSDEPNPARAIPGILDYQKEQRGYHYLGTLTMNDEIIETFNNYKPETVNNYLKKLMEVERVESV
jgi:hypothetical protein